MQKSSFFNSVNGDRRYKAEEFAEYFASFIGNGVFLNPSTGLQVATNADMTVIVKVGKAWINGYFLANTSDAHFTLANADGVLKRIDRIVAKWSLSDRSITIQVKQGSFASTPAPPILQRDAEVWELAFVDIFIDKGTTSIKQADITDLRLSTDLCGIVHGTVEQVDTMEIFRQYEDWFAEFTQESYNDFMAWFESIREILDENTAAHLLNLINSKQDRITVSGILKSDGNTVTAAIPDVDYASGESLTKINRIVLSGNANIGDVVALTMSGTAEKATDSGFDTLT